jgi:hypothetical protein
MGSEMGLAAAVRELHAFVAVPEAVHTMLDDNTSSRSDRVTRRQMDGHLT